MAKRQIVLTVTFKAEYQGRDMDMLENSELMVVEEEVSLTIPQLEDKFVVFPKVLEGVTAQVIAAHNDKVYAYLSERAKKEKEAKERSKQFQFPDLTQAIVETAKDFPAPDDGVETTLIYKGVEYPMGNGGQN